MSLYVDAGYTVDDADYFLFDSGDPLYWACDYVVYDGVLIYVNGDDTCPITDATETTTTGGWLSEEQLRAHDEHRRKRKARERELEETIELAYKRLTGKISAKKIIEPTKGEPEKLSELGKQLAAQLVTKGQDSARLRTRNAQIIADLKRLANEVIEYQEAQAYAMQMEEEAIIMLLLT